MSEETDWEAWRKADHYVTRAVLRDEAERAQLEIKDEQDTYHGCNSIYIRGVFRGLINPDYDVKFKMYGGEAAPMIQITHNEKLISIIALHDLRYVAE